MLPRVVLLAFIAATFFTQSSSAQPQNSVRNDLPQPYRTTRDWGQLPPGVAWAAVTAVEPAPNGTIFVIHRCFENSCAGRKEAPILKYDSTGKLLASCGNSKERVEKEIAEFEAACNKQCSSTANAAVPPGTGTAGTE